MKGYYMGHQLPLLGNGNSKDTRAHHPYFKHLWVTVEGLYHSRWKRN